MADKDNDVEKATSSDGDSMEKDALAGNAGGDKTIEETYQKKTQLEHILLRPDTYIGSTERVTQPMFVLDKEKKKIVEKEITFTPGLYKIFDEIVVNAADNKQRDENMSELHISIDAEDNLVTVKNNGKGIPVEMHKEYECYVPSLIFGELLTGSNFDDDEAKTTGGRNGFGAKLCNVFSLEFTIECLDSKRGLKLTQTFRENMTLKEDPIIERCKAAEKRKGDLIKVSFRPDLERFKMSGLDEDCVALLSKRAYDIAGSMASRHGKKLSVYLNEEKLPIKSFQDYLNLFEGINPPVAYEKCGDRWEVGVAPSEDSTSQQISFVNAISTSKGGGHVNYILDQIANHLVKTIRKKNKGGSEVKSGQIKNHLCIFVNCLIENPTFDSQTKENCTTRPKSFGSECTLSDKFLKQVDKSAIVENILSYAQFKQNQALKRKGGSKRARLTGMPKLDDANYAGTAKSRDCTLIITEGDSAKSLAMSGLSVIGRDYYGVFPLRGKPLNVRDASHAAIMKNEEIKNLTDIIGLKYQATYDESNIKTLRYGHLMIMADQDTDGSHIKGLVINFIHHFWPSLLDVDGFLKQFITPIVKATKGSTTKTFFTIREVEAFKAMPESNGFSFKYYKGLGTSTAEEAKDYFANLEMHEIKFGQLTSDEKTNEDDSDSPDTSLEDGGDAVPDKAVSGTDLIDMVFRKNRVEDRKTWLNNFEDDSYMDYSRAQVDGAVKYSTFINQELIQFSKYDNMRSIPHFVDGFKPSQRKVLFACFKKNLTKEIKVAQLAGYVGEKTAYHHGEASLHGTITNMAQTFCGSNNVNLLTPSGQFGTRRMGGKDAASPRYIFTKLEPVTRTIFHPDDDDLLEYLSDDGLQIEPKFYVPVIPLVLVNGSDGIGTGWSSTVPNYCPREIIVSLRRMIKGEEPLKLHPKYYGFTGSIIEKATNSYSVEGKIDRIDDMTLKITELPIRKWTQEYKTFLEGLLDGKKQEAELKDFVENHTDTTVSFTITADPAKIDEFVAYKGGLIGKFKLSSTLSNANMHLFDTEGKMNKFNSAQGILTSFYDLRLEYYHKRKALLVEKLGRQKRTLQNKARFVEEVCRGELVVGNRKRKELLADLKDRNYELFTRESTNGDGQNANNGGSDQNEDAESNDDSQLAQGYEYLLGMKIWSLTFEKAMKLRQELEAKTQELEELEATSPSQIWLNDLDAIEIALNIRDEKMKEAADREKAARDAAAQKRDKGKKKPAKRRARKSETTSKPTKLAGKDTEKKLASPVSKKPAAKTNPAASPPSPDTPLGKSDEKEPNMVSPPPIAGEKRKGSPIAETDLENSDGKKQRSKPSKRVKTTKAQKPATKKTTSSKKTISGSSSSDDALNDNNDSGGRDEKTA